MIRLVYVAGRYRAPTVWERDCNIHAARKIGALVVGAGAYPVIPQSNTSHFDGLADDPFWLDGTLQLMRRCDAVIMCPGWEASQGATGERAEALRLGLPVLYDIGELRHWLEGFLGEQKTA